MIVYNGHINTRLSYTVLGSVVRVLANSRISASASTTHFRSGKVGVVVGSVTSLSEMILAIVRTRVSLGVEVISRGVFAGFRGGGGGKDGLSSTACAAHGGGGECGRVVD